jgi:hydroxyacylglutathione hydrolase
MFIKQFVDEGLGNSSYLVGSEETGQIAAIDPQRDVDRYVQFAEGLGLQLSYVLDTHLHNDFVSGAREMAAQAGVTVGASAEARLAFDHLPLSDGGLISLGDVTIHVMTTPGHTPEHISFLAVENGKQKSEALFSGGALIVGGAARTDLLGEEMTGPLTRQLYHTIHEKLLPLSDDLVVYPTHGAGSFCVAPGTTERVTTLGQEKLANPLVRAGSEEEFLALATHDLPSYPDYFRYMRKINQAGPPILGGIPLLEPLSPSDVQEYIEQGVVLIDTRTPAEFAAGHIPGAYGIPLAAPLITWAGWMVPFTAPVILVSSGSDEQMQAVRQLLRIGYDDLRGFLAGGIVAWEAAGLPVERVPVIPARVLREQMASGAAPLILDVRQEAEWQAGHLPQAIHIEAGRLPHADLPFSQEDQIVVHCGHSDRSTVGISVLQRRGFHNLTLLVSGWIFRLAPGRVP